MDLNGTQIASAIGVAMMLLLMIHRLILADLPGRRSVWMLLIWALIVIVATVVVVLLRPVSS